MSKKIIITTIIMFSCLFGVNIVKAEETVGTTNIETTISEDNNSSNTVDCGIVLSDPIKNKINWFLDLIKYGGAVLVIILGSADFLRATLSDEDGATKKAFQKFIKRILAAVLLFLLPLLIQFLFTTVDSPVIRIPGFNVDKPTCGIGVSE